MTISHARRATHARLLGTVLGALAGPAWLMPARQASAAPSAKDLLDRLADDYYRGNASFDPLSASESGDSRYNGQLGLPINPDIRARHIASLRALRERVRRISRDALDDKARINYDILAFELDSTLSLAPFPEHLLPLNQMVAVPVILFYQTVNFHHYIVDAMIWKARKKPIQKVLALSES